MKIRYINRDKNYAHYAQSHARVIVDLGFASNQQTSHEIWTIQFFIPSYVNNHYTTSLLDIVVYIFNFTK